jgi:decaprenylphospho-beta-D-ribofuranose 2-oxidase
VNAASTSAITGWGRANATRAALHHVASRAEITSLVGAEGNYIARGLGRAYGDAAQCAGGAVIDLTGLEEIIDFDTATGVVRCEAGCSLDTLSRFSVPRGWFVPVTPGTAYVTIGGAIAADVHGKNHHREGSLGGYLREIVLLAPEGEHHCSRESEPDLFLATIGGMGMTGVIVEATLSLMPIESAYISVDTERTGDIEATMAALASGDSRYRYSVAWVDATQRGRHLGRSVITSGDHTPAGALNEITRHSPLLYDPRQRLRVPYTPPSSLVTPATQRAFNELWFRRAPVHREAELTRLNTFFYPLDMLGSWNRLYGPRGFTQYQFVVPFGHESLVRGAIESLQRAGAPASLVVLKRFGAGGPSPLSFPMPGWTLALDIPLGAPELAETLDDLDERIAEVGGRIYLAKDGRLRPELVGQMYPRLEEFRAVCRRVDPEGRIASDLARRIDLLGDKGRAEQRKLT